MKMHFILQIWCLYQNRTIQELYRRTSRANNTDVVVLPVSIASTIPTGELWVAYDTGKRLQNSAIHTTVSVLGRKRAFVLPLFHALTGCVARAEARRQHGTSGVYYLSLQLHC